MIAEGNRYHTSMRPSETNSTVSTLDASAMNQQGNCSSAGHAQSSTQTIDDDDTPADDDGACR